MRVAAVVRDLILASRIEEAATRAGATLRRYDAPTQLPPPAELDLVIVDWAERAADWGPLLVAWRGGEPGARPRLLLVGPHTDRAAHDDARRHRVGPMWARSKLVASLPDLLGAN